MNDTPSCGTCRYYAEGEVGGLCRRMPPRPLFIGAVNDNATPRVPQPVVATFFPEQPPTGWCGEWTGRVVEAVDA